MQTRGANKYERQKAEDSCSSGNTFIVLYSTDSLFGRPDCIAPMIDYLCLMSKLLAKTFFFLLQRSTNTYNYQTQTKPPK